MKVCMLSSYPPMRCGVGDYTRDLCLHLKSEGVDIDVLTLRVNGAPSSERDGRGIYVHRLLNANSLGSMVARYVRMIGPDVLHFQSTTLQYGPFFNLFPAFLGGSNPLIITVHDCPFTLRQIYRIPPLRYAYGVADKLLTHSEHIRTRLISFHKVNRDKLILVPHGVDTSRYNPAIKGDEFAERFMIDGGTDFVVLFFGFIRPGKGLEYLIRAVKQVSGRIPEIKLIIAGGLQDTCYIPGERSLYYFRKIRYMVKELGLETKTVFTGYVKDDMVSECLACCDVVILPYEAVSQSGPLFKALAMGKPVVASDVGSFGEVITDRVNGLLVPSRDVHALVNAIYLLYQNEELKANIGLEARKLAVDKYSWDRVAHFTKQIYKSLEPDAEWKHQ